MTGVKRRRGVLIIMVAKGGDVDHIETAYEALAQQGTTKISLGEMAIALQMTTKEDKAQRSMLTQEESEIQDNIQTIANNRNQVKAIGFKGITHDAISNYEKETNEFLSEQGSSGKVLMTEHLTATINRGDMEIFIITVASPRDRAV
jgi:hypothetical protein